MSESIINVFIYAILQDIMYAWSSGSKLRVLVVVSHSLYKYS